MRYNITFELLPRAEGKGRWSRYTVDHLNRLILIRKPQDGHVPLSEIGEFIKAVDAQVAEDKPAALLGPGRVRRRRGEETRPNRSTPTGCRAAGCID